MNIAFSKNFLTPILGQKVRINLLQTDRAKMDLKSAIAIIIDIKDKQFYELGRVLHITSIVHKKSVDFINCFYFLNQGRQHILWIVFIF